MAGPVAALLGEDRLHLHHGPIDLIVSAEGPRVGDRQVAFAAAARRFDGLLEALAADLPAHRQPLMTDTPTPADPVARRMYDAAWPFCGGTFLTPMIAVAGAVADAVLAAMLEAAPLTRACVNNGGDMALHLAPGAWFAVAMSDDAGRQLGRIALSGGDGIGGIATSGTRGRSFSLGIADSVTVLARDAAAADVAATLIANAVDLDHPGITRVPAAELAPDSDLGDRPVVTSVPALAPAEIARALGSGEAVARALLEGGHILGAALFLRGQSRTLGRGLAATQPKEIVHA